MWQRIQGLFGHSAFWLAVCSIILNLAPYCYAELADYPQAMRWVKIATAAAWVIWLYLGGKLPDPAPPGLLQRAEPTPAKKNCADRRR